MMFTHFINPCEVLMSTHRTPTLLEATMEKPAAEDSSLCLWNKLLYTRAAPIG